MFWGLFWKNVNCKDSLCDSLFLKVYFPDHFGTNNFIICTGYLES